MEYEVKVKIELSYYIETNGPEQAMQLALGEASDDINDSDAEIDVIDVALA